MICFCLMLSYNTWHPASSHGNVLAAEFKDSIYRQVTTQKYWQFMEALDSAQGMEILDKPVPWSSHCGHSQSFSAIIEIIWTPNIRLWPLNFIFFWQHTIASCWSGVISVWAGAWIDSKNLWEWLWDRKVGGFETETSPNGIRCMFS